MALSPRIYQVVLLCLALPGCAGPAWLQGKSVSKEPARLEEPDRVENPVTHLAETPAHSAKRALGAVTGSKTAATALRGIPEGEVAPIVTKPVKPDSAASRLVAELKARGDIDARTAAGMEEALSEPDPAVRDLLIQTQLAVFRGKSREKEEQQTPKDVITEEPVVKVKAQVPVAKLDGRDVKAEQERVASDVAIEPVPATSAPAASAPAASAPAASAPATSSPATLPWTDSLSRSIEALEAELAGWVVNEGVTKQPPAHSPEERARLEARLRLLYAAADRRPDAAQPIRGQDQHRQEFWKSQLHAIGVLLDPKGPPADDKRAALALRHVREAADHLASASTLDVRNLAFVSRVESYGRFTEFPKAHFQPDQEVLLYVEVDNFAVEAKPQGYETALEGSYQILDAAGQRVADHTFPVEKETCRRPRRDFFIPYRLYLPKSAPPGDYTLQLTIKDMKGDKFGQGNIRFTLEPNTAAK